MQLETQLGALSDDALLIRLDELAKRQHALTAVLLAHIAEVDKRRLYLRQACSSMHRYCVERLGLSDGAAYKRIHAARAARRYPVIFEMVERGELHLKGLTLLAPHLRETNYLDLLERAKHQPVRAIEKLVAELVPRPDVASRVRVVPQRVDTPPLAPSPAPAPAPEPSLGVSAEPSPGGEAPAAAPSPGPNEPAAPERPKHRPVTPLAPRRYELRITIDEKTHSDLEQLQNLHSHQIPDRDPATIVSRALALLLERSLARKAAVTEGPRKSSEIASGEGSRAGSPRSRHIPAKVRREVWSRDGGRCAFRDAAGRRCTCKGAIEFHHIDNWARGADHDPERLELRCRAHNQYQAVLDYGEAFMNMSREGKGPGRSGAREPARAYLVPRLRICG